MTFLYKNDIGFIDCALPLNPGMRIPGNSHPNGRMHALWAETLAKALQDRTAR